MKTLIGLWIFIVAVESLDDGSKIFFENELPVQAFSSSTNLKTEKTEYISSAICKLSLNLDSAISSFNPYENTLFSPVPIVAALAILHLGARGKTAAELSNVLGFNPGNDIAHRTNLIHKEFGDLLGNLISDPGVIPNSEISAASAVFPNKNHILKHDFVQDTENIYYSEVVPLDYFRHGAEAVKIINNWVSNQTHHRIKQLLDEVPPPDTSLIIATALYFNSNWENPFLTGMTKERPFYTGREILDVPMMVNAAEVEYFDDRTRRCQMIGLPYKGKEVYMYIVLPEGDLRSFMANIRDYDLETMVNSSIKTQVIYMMPRMKIENNIDLGPILQRLGLTSLFDRNTADLRNIADGVFVNKIIHKVELEVTETGTTGSAATGVTLTRDGFTPVVRVEKPFLFFIHHRRTNLILFWGTVIKPTPFNLHNDQ